MNEAIVSDADYCADQVRRHDPDRWLCALFLPDAARPAALALAAFNLELSRARESVSEVMLGQIRLQWWRESIEGIFAGRLREQPVVRALGQAIAEYGLPRALLDGMVDAREQDLAKDPPANMAALIAYAGQTAGALLLLTLQVAAGPASTDVEAAGNDTGIAFALAGLLRAIPYHLAHGKVFLPADLLGANGLLADHIRHEGHSEAMHAIVAAIAETAGRHLIRARQARGLLARPARRVLLPACLAGLYLDRLRLANHDPESPLLAISPVRRQWTLFSAALRNRY